MFELGTDGPSVIMVGLDGSNSSMRAAAYAAGLARRQRSLLALVYVQPLGMVGAPEAAAAASGLGQEIAAEIEQEIRAATDRVPPEERVRWEFHTLRGDPYNGLIETAERLRADAVGIGASEKAGHRILGALGVRLVKAGRWPVTVVP